MLGGKPLLTKAQAKSVARSFEKQMERKRKVIVEPKPGKTGGSKILRGAKEASAFVKSRLDSESVEYILRPRISFVLVKYERFKGGGAACGEVGSFFSAKSAKKYADKMIEDDSGSFRIDDPNGWVGPLEVAEAIAKAEKREAVPSLKKKKKKKIRRPVDDDED